jgi:lantibiotic biosynthesis protein
VIRDPARLAAAVARAHQQSPLPDITAFRPSSLGGDLGVAVTFGALAACFPEEGWRVDAHRHVEIAARSLERSPTGSALFEGFGALGFAASYLAGASSRYARLLERVDDCVCEGAEALAETVISRHDGFHIAELDLVSGLAGHATYLLARRSRTRPAAALRRVLEALVTLATPAREGVPRWHTPRSLVMQNPETLRTQYTDGYLDCGLAHGIPGPLAVLSIATREGVEVPGARDAIATFADWLLAHRKDDAWGINWPAAVPLQVDARGEPEPVLPSASLGNEAARSGWCYGAPGIARALWLAGAALGELRYQQSALDAIRATFRRPWSERRIDSPTFCHGVAGYLQCVLRFAHETRLPELVLAARTLTGRLLAMRAADAPLGYRTLEMYGTPVDQPGLVDGAAGVVAVLLSASTGVEPAWDRAFLLA